MEISISEEYQNEKNHRSKNKVGNHQSFVKQEILDLNEKEIILRIISDSKIYDIQDEIESKWDELISEDHKFYNNNKSIINILNEKILKLIKNKWIIVGLIKIFFKFNFISEEVLNTLFMINNTLNHLMYFDKLFSNKSFNKHTNTREIDQYLTESYLNNNSKFFFLLNNYKTKISNKSLTTSYDDEIYYNDFTDKRREVFLDIKGYFNYINYRCPYKSHDIKDENCPYSHNNKEILYHPLNLKTRFCRDKINCLREYCPFSHNLQDDFRFIYGPLKRLSQKIISIFKKLELFNCISINKNISTNLNNLNILPSEFHPDTYKTIECPLYTDCKLDSKLCLNYHNLFERRRDPRVYNYSSKQCEFVFSEGKWKNPLNCRRDDSCNYCHNIYEFLYSKEIFRHKICLFEAKGKSCEYLLICPYKHKSDTRDSLNGICYNLETSRYYLDSIKDKINEEFKKLKHFQSIIDQNKCHICKNEFGGRYFKLSCGDIICRECNESWKKDKQQICVLCKKALNGFNELWIKDK